MNFIKNKCIKKEIELFCVNFECYMCKVKWTVIVSVVDAFLEVLYEYNKNCIEIKIFTQFILDFRKKVMFLYLSREKNYRNRNKLH